MAKPTVPTGALLVCGVVAGPLYVAITGAQALTREGFDQGRHTWNVMTAGDLGWIQRSNLLLTGLLMVLFAVGVGRALRPGWGARWGSWLLGLYALGHHITGGVFAADPQPGFPPGASPETTWQGVVHFAARGGGYAVLFVAGLVITWWFAAEGRHGWAWLSLVVVPPVVAAAAHEILADSPTPTAVFIVLTLVPTWVWLTTLAVHLYRRTDRRAAAPSGAGPSRRIAAEAG